jgi:DNA polymerase III subunit epsilon
MKKKVYTIIDIETTGGRANRDKITEIAIIKHDGEKIIDSFETLINPERTIPYNITQITGITQEMVADAPKFFEVAKTIVEMTEDAVFVAHNVRFDYTFLREEFRRLGFTFTRKQLCTVRLTRKTFPGLPSYSLGNLIRHFGIEVKQRHRAMADTKATVQLLEMALSEEDTTENVSALINLGIKESQLPANITLEKLHELPEECGVYYFHDKNGDLVYIGKSINIKKRVMEHFAKKTRKAEVLQQSVYDISFEVTGSELVALLQESHEIKYHHPYVNRAQRARNFQHALFSYKNEEGYISLNQKKVTAKERKTLNILRSYPTQISAKGALIRLAENFGLCQSYCHLDNTGKPCFYYHIHKCDGACIGEESVEDYNEKVLEAIETLSIDFDEDFIILDDGRNLEERAVVLIENGQYRGFGYIEKENINGNIEVLKDAIKPFNHNPDVVRIIMHSLNKGKTIEVISLNQEQD